MAESDRLARVGDDAQLLVGLLEGKTYAAAAEQAGMSERTARRRLQDPAVRAQLVEARRQVFTAYVARLTGMAGLVLETLEGLLQSESESIRMQAVRTAMTALPAAANVEDGVDKVRLEQRVAELERELRERERGRRAA